MREPPSQELAARLERLGIASAAEFRRMARRVCLPIGRGIFSPLRWQARELPRFESVWVDALAQARILTPFQAAQINAGRAESLRIGPYLLGASLRWPEYAACYRARRVDSGQRVRLAVVERAGRAIRGRIAMSSRPPSQQGPYPSAGGNTDQLLSRLETLAASSQKIQCEQLRPIIEVGAEGGRIWAASPWVEGRTAAAWMVHGGRFPPEIVLQIARAMVAGLARLERAGLCHGDVCAAGLMLRDAGGVVLLHPGLRAIVRPEEGYAHGDLLPEAYDYLAPERVTDGAAPTIASDMYACGCLWWHMLCGRPPLAGGNSLAKLRAAQAAKIVDPRRLAPEVPGPLGAAVSACLKREPGDRPESMARLAAMLGPPGRPPGRAFSRRSDGRVRHWPAGPIGPCLATAPPGCLAHPRGPTKPPARRAGTIAQRARRRAWLAATAGCVLAATGVLWPIWRAGPAGASRDQHDWAHASPQGSTAGRGRAAAASEAPGPSGNSCGCESGYAGAVSASRVVAADYQTEPLAAETDAPAAPDLVLACEGPLRLDCLRLRPGQCVRGVTGRRPKIMVPRTGLVVETQMVCFENCDFVWNHPPEGPDATFAPAACVDLRASRAEFRGCLFRSARLVSAPPAAVRWTHPVDRADAALRLPSGRVRLSDCTWHGVGVGVDCRAVGALAVEATNTLHLGSGPLVRLDHCPKPDEPVLIAVSQVTLRNSGPLVECRYDEVAGQPGPISVEAVGCVFVPGPGSPLIRLRGPQPPEGILGQVRWTGLGSLVSPQAVIAAWRRSDGQHEALDDAAASIAGLVRSRVRFAGTPDAGPSASRAIRWQAPLRSTAPPGIDPARIPWRSSSPARQ